MRTPLNINDIFIIIWFQNWYLTIECSLVSYRTLPFWGGGGGRSVLLHMQGVQSVYFKLCWQAGVHYDCWKSVWCKAAKLYISKYFIYQTYWNAELMPYHEWLRYIFINISPRTGNLLSRQISKTNQLEFFANWIIYI